MSLRNNDVFISVIIPVYNSGDKIVNSIQGVLNQTFSSYEILIMDGGSTDTTHSYLQQFESNSKIKIFIEKDKGIYDAINKGIIKANGKWVYVLGSDDKLFSEDVFSDFYNYALSTDARFIYGNVIIEGDAGWAKDGDIYDGKFDLHKVITKNICQQAVFYQKTLFEKYGLFEISYTTCSDWDFVLRIIKFEKLDYFNFIVAKFKGGGTSVTRIDQKFQDDLPLNLYKYFGNHLKNPVFFSVRYRILDLAGQFHTQGKKWKAFKCSRIFKWLDSHPPAP